MASVIALPALGSGPRERSPARAAFARVFNLRNIAAVFYFCFVLLLGRFLMELNYEPADVWAFNLVRYLRQTMISASLMLLAIASVEAFVASRRLTSRAALTVGIVVSMLASAVALPIRVWVAGSPLANIAQEPFYFLQIWSLWSAVGCIGYWLFHTINAEESARSQLADAECRREGLQAQMVEARLCALQAQIEPHFLFNTLANVKRLYETAPVRGREMLSSLISYLRAALPTMREPGSTLERELELVRSFLTILKMRMGDRLAFSIDAPAELASAPCASDGAADAGRERDQAWTVAAARRRSDRHPSRRGRRPAARARDRRRRRRLLVQQRQRRWPGQHPLPPGGAVRHGRVAVAINGESARRCRDSQAAAPMAGGELMSAHGRSEALIRSAQRGGSRCSRTAAPKRSSRGA